MSASDYQAPEIKETVKKEPVLVQEPIAIKAVAETVEKTSNENFFRTMTDKYFKYLNEEIGFSNDAERLEETKAYMQRIGIMLTYDYDEFEDCILYLIQKLRNTPKAHDKGRFFRYVNGVENFYPIESITQYRLLLTWCIRIATSWASRANHAHKTDILTLSKGMRKEAKENLNYFVRKMANFGIQ